MGVHIQFLFFSIMELKPPIVSLVKSLMEPLSSRTRTISTWDGFTSSAAFSSATAVCPKKAPLIMQ